MRNEEGGGREGEEEEEKEKKGKKRKGRKREKTKEEAKMHLFHTFLSLMMEKKLSRNVLSVNFVGFGGEGEIPERDLMRGERERGKSE